MDDQFTEPRSGNPGGEAGNEFVRLGAAKTPPTTQKTDAPEAVNLCELFKPEELKNMSGKCLDDYRSDVKSREPRMRKIREFTDLYASQMRPKSFPFNNCANVSLPTLTGPWLQVHARLFDMVWPANGKVIISCPTNLGDKFRADTTEKFANSYIRHKMPEMGVGLDDTMSQVVGYGSAFRRTYWNSYDGRVCSDYIPIQDFVVAHSVRSQDPSMRDVARYTLVQHFTIYDLESYGAQGVFANVKGIKSAEVNDADEDRSLQSTVDKLDGVTEPTEASDEDKDRQVLEMHRVWRMPNRKGKSPLFDGKPHPVMITIDVASKRVLRVAIREEDDPADAKRFQREEQAHEQWRIQHEAFVDQMAQMADVVAAAAQMGKEIPADLPLPQDAGTEPEVAPQRKREICFFTHYRAFPSEGFYGLGFGDFIGPLAKAVNTLINQHIDGVTLRNAKPVFMNRNLRTQRGTVNIQPGEVIEVDGSTQAMKDGIFWMDPPLNDPTTMPLASMIGAMADKVSGSGDLMSGQTSGANRTAKEIQILNTQVMMAITVLARRVKEAQKHELDKIWRCFGVCLPDEEIVDIIDEAGSPQSIKIGRGMFIPDAHVMPAADPRMKFERVEDQTILFQLVAGNPYLMQSPNAGMLMKMATEDLFRAHGAERYIPLIPEPPPPPPPPQAKPPFEEEAGWLKGQDSPVHPDDDDAHHITSHGFFASSQPGGALDKTGVDMKDRHIRAHVAQAWMKMHGAGPVPGSAPSPGAQGPPMPPSHHEGGSKGAPPPQIPGGPQ